MKTVFTNHRAVAIGVVVVALIVVGAVALSHHSISNSSAGGGSGVSRVNCSLSHIAQVDPIVSPGVPSAHMHDFFGNNSTDANSTYATMTGRTTTCSPKTDTAAYWVPTLYDSAGMPVPIDVQTVYYRDDPDHTTPVVPFPPDFRMVFGYPEPHYQSGPIKRGAYGWNCDNTEPLGTSVAINCTGHVGSGDVIGTIFFKNCGMRDASGNIVTDSADHRSHVAYEVKGHCPADYPVKLPTVYFKTKYAITNCIAAGCYLSSDTQYGTPPGESLHGDFWNTWDQSALVNFVNICLNTAPTSACPGV